jgi:prepilin-type N-terminal cleavage/methylation domain-containing protein/prepilin-type processing-associated H-X9-DG protein
MPSPRLCPNRQSAPAFTLIEILVVVAIIALLIAVLLPSLSRARENAKASVCASNGHQMGLALQMYTNVYKYTTGHHLTGSSVTPTEHILFPIRLLRAMQANGGKRGQAQIFWCPTSISKEKWDGVKRIVPSQSGLPNDFPTFDYAINDWGTTNVSYPCQGMGGHIFDPNHQNDWAQSRWYGEVPADRIKRPGHMIAFGDNNINQAGQYDWDTAMDPTNESEWPGNRHTNRAMIVWADGHANLQPQKILVDKNKEGVRRMWNNDDKPHW